METNILLIHSGWRYDQEISFYNVKQLTQISGFYLLLHHFLIYLNYKYGEKRRKEKERKKEGRKEGEGKRRERKKEAPFKGLNKIKCRTTN